MTVGYWGIKSGLKFRAKGDAGHVYVVDQINRYTALLRCISTPKAALLCMPRNRVAANIAEVLHKRGDGEIAAAARKRVKNRSR